MEKLFFEIGMKKVVLLFVFLIGFVSIGVSQNILEDTIYEAGIYRTFDEFKNNSPSIPFHYEVILKQRGYGAFFTEGKVDFYKIVIDKVKAKECGEIFGFSDGKNLFVLEHNRKLTPKTEFVKISEIIGSYCYYETRGMTSYYNINGGTSYSYYLKQVLLKMSTGTHFELTQKDVKEMLAKYPDLLDQFKAEPYKSKVLKDYAFKAIIRHERLKVPKGVISEQRTY